MLSSTTEQVVCQGLSGDLWLLDKPSLSIPVFYDKWDLLLDKHKGHVSLLSHPQSSVKVKKHLKESEC